VPKKKVDEAIEITPIQMASVKCHLIGTSPLIMHRFRRRPGSSSSSRRAAPTRPRKPTI